jgi:glycosyltransferase involved in cell wall biosynthesis
MKLHGKGRLLLAQRANVDRYPPVLHQIRLLGASREITVVDSVVSSEPGQLQTAPEVRRVRVREEQVGGRASMLFRATKAFAFARTVKGELSNAPDAAIAYDPDTAALLLRSPKCPLTKRVVHLHEALDTSSVGRSTRIAARYLLKNLARAELVIVPDVHRAQMVMRACGLEKEPLVVMNCPLLIQQLPESRLLPALRERGIITSDIVHYQGAIGPDHYLETIISSMQRWPSGAVFVVVGSAHEEYRRRLQEHAASLGVAERVIWLGLVPYRDLFSHTVGAAVGLTFLESTTDNWRFSAGASNKRFEYAAMGVAQVTNTGAGMEEIFGRPGLAVLLDRLDAASMGDAIRALLSDANRRAEMGQRARRAHLSVNNYEVQFAPVMSRIESWVRG